MTTASVGYFSSNDLEAFQSFDDCPGNGDAPLEEWPINRQDLCTPNIEATKKQVRFAESSMMRVYKEDYSYSKSYTRTDRKNFGRKVIIDAQNIKKILEAATECTSIMSTSRRLESCGIRKEDIVGLENLALSKSPKDSSKLRKFYVRTILLEQEKQRMMGCSDADRMANLACCISTTSGRYARRRAAMAA